MAKQVSTWRVASINETDSNKTITLNPSVSNETALLGWNTQLTFSVDKGDPNYNHFQFGKEYEVFVLTKTKIPSLMPLAGTVHIDNK
ncbi:MAG: hypothetical protein F9K23_15920 [Bacteroidetes bacterium]|nr:MAG: hypothetical protein F9K23_15920 [Bacteroidota bacterium]